MKKLLSIVAVVFLGLVTVNAQDDQKSDSQITFGIKAGVNFATGLNEEVSGLKGRTSFHVGGVANVPISELFSVQPELLYSAQGAKWSDYTIMVDYINVPVMASYEVIDGLSLQAGPQIGFNISSKYKVDGGNENPNTDTNTTTSISLERGLNNSSEFNEQSSSETEKIDNTSSIDFGVGVGAQYDLSSNFFAQARYTIGLNDVFDTVKGKNKVLSISVVKLF